MYTSDAPPVEADEYERMKRRAEAAEKRVQELTAMLNGQERLARENAQEFDKVFAGLNQGLLLSSELYRQWQDATARAEAAELSLKLIKADNRDLIEAHRRIGELERELADAREGHTIDNDEGVNDKFYLGDLREDTDDVLDSLDKTAIKGAINWADLRCVSTTKVYGNHGRTWFRVEIEEAAPGEEALIAAVTAGLAAKGWHVDDIEITTEW